MIREIVIFGDPVLRKVGAKIDAISGEITKLAADMIDTMRSAETASKVGRSLSGASQACISARLLRVSIPRAPWPAAGV